jgi:hypothetical protein
MDGVSDETLSGSLLYRLANLKEAIRPLALATEDLATNRERIVRLIGYEIGHSVKIRENAKEVKQRIFAEQLAGLMVRHHSTQPGWYNPEAAVIARFSRRTGGKEGTMNIWYELTPVDTLFFRGAEAMEAGLLGTGALFPPPVSVVLGALRSAVVRQSGSSFTDYNTGNCPSKLIEMIGESGAEAPFRSPPCSCKKMACFMARVQPTGSLPASETALHRSAAPPLPHPGRI